MNCAPWVPPPAPLLMWGEVMLPALYSGGFSYSLLSVGEAWLLALDHCRFWMSPSTRLQKCTSGSTCLRTRMMEGDMQWTSKMPRFQSPVLVHVSLPANSSLQAYRWSSWSTSLSFHRVSHSLSRRTHNKMRVDSWWPSDQIPPNSGPVITIESRQPLGKQLCALAWICFRKEGGMFLSPSPVKPAFVK